MTAPKIVDAIRITQQGNEKGGGVKRPRNSVALPIAEVRSLLEEMAATDYTPSQYDFFMRNCNHFCYDLAERLAGPWQGASLALSH